MSDIREIGYCSNFNCANRKIKCDECIRLNGVYTEYKDANKKTT